MFYGAQTDISQNHLQCKEHPRSQMPTFLCDSFESHKKVADRKLEVPLFEGDFGKYGFRGQTEAGIVKSICKL